MAEPKSPLVHTDAGAPEESKAYASGYGSIEPWASSSAEERPVHTGKVGGSTPSSPTIDPLAQMLADSAWRMRVEGRFWPKVMRLASWDECWLWTGARKQNCPGGGYGNFKLTAALTSRASRVAYALYYGRSPGDLFVCHRCDNPPCCNPLHLFLGTVQDNADDMVRKGRQATYDGRGENNRAAKLTAEQVEKIRDLIRAGLTNVAIAARFGITHQLVSRIRRGRSWGGPVMQPKYASLRRSA